MSIDDAKMDEYRVDFIKSAFDAGALKFGSFTLKSGRQAIFQPSSSRYAVSSSGFPCIHHVTRHQNFPVLFQLGDAQ
jgi:hypothetical protein